MDSNFQGFNQADAFSAVAIYANKYSNASGSVIYSQTIR